MQPDLKGQPVTYDSFEVSTDDDTRLATYRWPASDRAARAIVIIVHGMAEHARRYDRFARALAADGIDVYAFDLRGHGATTPAADHGYLGANADWRTLLDDIARLRTHALDQSGRLPVYLFGHSLGSFLVQSALGRRGAGYAGAMLSGVDLPSRSACRLAALVAALESSRVDATGHSRLLQRLTFGTYNRRIARRAGAVETEFDWLSSDPNAVHAYIRDQDCGFALATDSWRRLLRGIARASSPHRRRRIPARLPLLIVAGRDDAMGGFGRGPNALARSLAADGQQGLELRLYDGARHELLHDYCADTVTRDIRAWLASRQPPAAASHPSTP